MRAARRLKPETFPFLAVLLCAMGALILLLLVMDRRAKAVARAKAAAQQVVTVDPEVEKRLAEEEKQSAEARRLREEAVAALLEEERHLREKIDSARSRADVAGTEADTAETRVRELRGRLETEQQAVKQDEDKLVASRDRVGAAEKTAERTRAEATSLSGELERLEKLLASLKEKRQRERQTYSLIPYRGRRGDNRKPLYLECGPAGLVFHPDRLTLEGASLTAARLRDEVQKRVKRLGGSKDTAYLFFLVRPEGISRYYDAVASLTGIDVEFGYELVEKDWALDLSDTPETAPRPAEPVPTLEIPGLPAKAGTGKGPPRGIAFGQPEPPPAGEPPGTGNVSRQPSLTPGPALPRGIGGTPRPLSPGVLSPFVERSAGGNQGEPGSLPPIVDTKSPPSNPALGKPEAEGGAPPSKPGRSEAQGGAPPSGQPALGKPEAEGTPPSGHPDVLPGPPEQSPARPRVVGTRELVFRVECKANEAILYPGGSRFETSVVGNEQGMKALARALEQMIQRRQASVRPGETGYRPQVRFLVRPDGLRSFFLLYPTLEPLGVPMTRQDLQDDDELP